MISFYPLEQRLQFIYVAWSCLCNITEQHKPICSVNGELLLLSTSLDKAQTALFKDPVRTAQ